MQLPASARAWGAASFAAVLKRELAAQADALPLQQALAGTSAVANEPITVVMLDARADALHIYARVGVFFGGILAGCSCADDPTPAEAQTEYCELELGIDRSSGDTAVRLNEG